MIDSIIINPRFITLADALRIHAAMLEHSGGRDGLRDHGLLESALAQPQQTFGGQFLHPTIAGMAGAYLFHLSQNQAFFDGNKRTAVATSLEFSWRNRLFVVDGQEELHDLVIAVAERRANKAACGEFFTWAARPAPRPPFWIRASPE